MSGRFDEGAPQLAASQMIVEDVMAETRLCGVRTPGIDHREAGAAAVTGAAYAARGRRVSIAARCAS